MADPETLLRSDLSHAEVGALLGITRQAVSKRRHALGIHGRVKPHPVPRRHRAPPADAHGKLSTYTNFACRCAHCLAAGAAYRAAP